MTAATERLLQSLSPELVDALLELVDERVEAAVAERLASADGPAWLTLKQAAKRLDCSVDAVRMRVKRGRLEACRQGSRVYVAAASVERLA